MVLILSEFKQKEMVQSRYPLDNGNGAVLERSRMLPLNMEGVISKRKVPDGRREGRYSICDDKREGDRGGESRM